MITNKNKYEGLHMYKEIAIQLWWVEAGCTAMCVLLYFLDVEFDSKLIKGHRKTKLPIERVNRILVSRKIASFCSITPTQNLSGELF